LKRALLVIDVQYEYFNGALPISYPHNSFENILKVMDTALEKKIPIIIIQHSNAQDAPTFRKGSAEWNVHEDVLGKSYDCIIEKNLPGSFTDTPLDDYLKENNIESLVICGYMSQMCCDTTARQALHRGYGVEFLSDATGTLDISNYAGDIKASELHKAVLITQAMRFSKVLSSEEWISSLK